MTDAIRELFELLAKKENTGSDYTGTVTRVEGNTAFVRFNGSDIDDTPVSLSIGASEGDTVRVRVADGRAWLVGNDTAPPNDSSGVAYDLIRTNAYIRELTTENIRGENGWINLLNGTFDYGNGMLAWNGDHLTVKGAITATSGKIGPWDIGATAIYKGSSTWGASSSGAAYFGDNGISITDKFKVNAAGALTATGANITGVITAESGKLGNWTLTSASISATANNANTGNVNRTTGLQWPGNGVWAIAVGATDASTWITAPFRVNHKGELYATGATITGEITATTGSIGGLTITNSINQGTTANGGHCYGLGMYAQCSDSNYEYEVGMKGDSGSPGYLAFYVGRITKGAAWSTNTKTFYVANNGALLATSGTIGPWTLNASGLSATVSGVTTQVYPSYIYLGSSSANCNVSATEVGVFNTNGSTTLRPTALDANSSATTGAQVSVTCSATNGRSGRLIANAGDFGLNDVSNGVWVLRSGSDGNVYVPHKFYCYGTEDTTGRMPVQSNTAAAGLVSVLSANSSALAVRGRWGATSGFSAKNFTPASSDIRIKSDINKSKIHALDLIRQIDICEFKKEGAYQPIGMIADWIEELDPLLTVGGGYDDNGAMNIKSVDTFYLMGYVVKAIQELENRLAKVGG